MGLRFCPWVQFDVSMELSDEAANPEETIFGWGEVGVGEEEPITAAASWAGLAAADAVIYPLCFVVELESVFEFLVDLFVVSSLGILFVVISNRLGL